MWRALGCLVLAGCVVEGNTELPVVKGEGAVVVDPTTQKVSLDETRVPVAPVACGPAQVVQRAAGGGWECKDLELPALVAKVNELQTQLATMQSQAAALSEALDQQLAGLAPLQHTHSSTEDYAFGSAVAAALDGATVQGVESLGTASLGVSGAADVGTLAVAGGNVKLGGGSGALRFQDGVSDSWVMERVPTSEFRVHASGLANQTLAVSRNRATTPVFSVNTQSGDALFSGNVGLPTANSTYKLQVVGNVRATGYLQVGGGNGYRFPFDIASNSCSSATCTATCPGSTVIAWAFGFHGFNGNNSASSAWVCGNPGGWQWMGNCIGASSCQVTTGCGASSIRLYCW